MGKEIENWWKQAKKEKNLLKTHNISRLAHELKLPEELLKKISLLEPIYQETRYPDIASKIPSEEFEEKDAKGPTQNNLPYLNALNKTKILLS